MTSKLLKFAVNTYSGRCADEVDVMTFLELGQSSLRKRILLLMLVMSSLLFFAIDTALAETIMGRWCDRMLPTLPQYNQVLSIIIAKDGRVVGRSEYGEGSSYMVELWEEAGGIFSVVGSSSGDKWRVVPNTGELQLLDDDGLIRIATRLENTPTDKECLH